VQITITTKKEGVMAGIIDFITDIGGDRELAGEFIEIISKPDCTHQDLVDFLRRKDYEEVVQGDVAKLMKHRNKIKDEYGIPSHVDY